MASNRYLIVDGMEIQWHLVEGKRYILLLLIIIGLAMTLTTTSAVACIQGSGSLYFLS